MNPDSLRNLKTEKEFFDRYDITAYERPSVTADVVALSVQEQPTGEYRRPTADKMSVLLIRRASHPFKGCWALPGGFFRPGETIEQTAARELEEETGLKGQVLMPVSMFTKPGRDPRGWIVSSAYLAIVPKSRSVVRGGDDAAEAKWFPVDDVLGRKVELAFDHLDIIKAAISLLRPVDRDALGFAFLPDEFTLAELRHVHEFMEGHELTRTNFGRKMESKIVLVRDGERSSAGHRPAALFSKRA